MLQRRRRLISERRRYFASRLPRTALETSPLVLVAPDPAAFSGRRVAWWCLRSVFPPPRVLVARPPMIHAEQRFLPADDRVACVIHQRSLPPVESAHANG